jgi:putative sugar O-methyltransferase
MRPLLIINLLPKHMTQNIKSTIAELVTLRDTNYTDSLSYPSGLWKNWLQKLSFAMDLSEKNLRDIRLHVGMGFFLGAPWSKVYYEANELRLKLKTPEESTSVQDYLRLTKGVDDQLKISELDPLREEIAIEHNGKYITEDVLRTQSTISNLRFFQSFNSCIEIGAGYGALANQIVRAYNVKKYYVIDYPEILFYVATWSKIVNPQRTIAIFNGRNQKEIENAGLILIPNFLQPEIDIEADLLINENSFCEMGEEQVLAYLDSKRLRTKYLYSNNRDRQFMNQQLTGLNALLDKRFNLSPSLSQYSSFYNQTPKAERWNMKYIFFASKTEPANVDILKLHGLTIRTQH